MLNRLVSNSSEGIRNEIIYLIQAAARGRLQSKHWAKAGYHPTNLPVTPALRRLRRASRWRFRAAQQAKRADLVANGALQAVMRVVRAVTPRRAIHRHAGSHGAVCCRDGRVRLCNAPDHRLSATACACRLAAPAWRRLAARQAR